jgi:hypothetical protein
MALNLEALEAQMIADMVVDLPDNVDQSVINIIEASAKRNAKTIYDFVKTGSVNPTNDGGGAETLFIQ